MVLREGGTIDYLVHSFSRRSFRGTALQVFPHLIGLVYAYLPYIDLTCYLSATAIDRCLHRGSPQPWRRTPYCSGRSFFRSASGLVSGSILIFVPVIGASWTAHPWWAIGVTMGTVIEDQFVQAFNWPLGAALSFFMLAVVLAIFAAPRASSRASGRALGSRHDCVCPPDADGDHRLPLSAHRHLDRHGFNASPLYHCRSMPTLNWFVVLAGNQPLPDATRNSLVIALATAAIARFGGPLWRHSPSSRPIRPPDLLKLLLLRRSPFLADHRHRHAVSSSGPASARYPCDVIGHVALAIPYVV